MTKSTHSISISVRLVDGSLALFDAEPDILERLNTFQLQGLEGKELINKLLSDDWGPPPLSVEISGNLVNGDKINIKIPYL